MLSKMPQIGTETNFADLFWGYKNLFAGENNNFSEALSIYLSARRIFLVNAGISAFYAILQALKKISACQDVILPAYTAPDMILAILKSGLKPVLCDISLADFNIDLNLLPKIISENTLCVVPTRLFGMPVSGMEKLERIMPPEIVVVEDCAQSFGSKIDGKHASAFSSIGFTSFNRGKNMSTYGGGCVFTNSSELAERIKNETDKLEEQNSFIKFMLPFKMMAIYLAVRPSIYGVLYHVISLFKDNQIPESFSVEKYSNFQAGVGLSLLKRIDKFSEIRYRNGMALINGLNDLEEIIVPSIPEDSRPAFNRLPIVFKDIAARDKIEKALWQSGVDTSRMYLRPLHHIFDLGYKKEDFPNAGYFAERLLTLPVHPMVSRKDIAKIIKVIKEKLV